MFDSDVVKVLKVVYDEVEVDEDYYLYYMCGWVCEMWIELMGFKVVLLLLEEVKKVEFVVDVVCVECLCGKMM